MRNTRAVVVSSAALLTAWFSRGAQAHHSFAMYDQTKSVTVTGALTRFIPGANHAQLLFEKLGADGKPELGADGKPIVWGVELGPAAAIAKQGITVESFPLGTIISVTLNPLRNGKPFGAMATGGQIVRCGATLPVGGCNASTGESFLQPREGFGTQRVQTQ